MTQSADMRRESGTCNVCAAPCSSCMHLNHALMGSKTDEFTDENCRLVEANQYSMDEGDVSSLRSRACESLQHAVSETSNMLSVNSSHDSLSENADSRRSLSNNYQDSKCLEVLDDNTSCLSRASEATLVDGRHYRNADRINLSCSSTSVSRLGAEGSGSAQSIDMSSLSEIPSCKDVNTDRSSPKVQSPCTQSQSGKSLSSIPSIMDLERDSCSHIPEKLSECSLENIDQSLTKEAAPTVVSGEKSLTDKNSLIDSTAKVSVKVYLNSEADTVNDVGDATDETRKCSVSGKQDERSEELVESPEADMQEHQSEDGSDESDVVEHDVKVCDICGDAGREDLLAICSRCSDGAEHTYCMREMLQKVPEGDWLCEECKYAGETENHRLEETENQRLDKSEIMPGIEKEETENQRLGKSEVMPGIEKDVEERKLHKVGSTSQIAGKRHSENIEIAPAAKRQAVESSTRSPKASSPKRLVSLSRESSFKSPDKGKVKPGNQLSFRSHSSGDDMEVARSPSNGPRGQMPKGTLLKSNSFSTLNSKPRVKLVDEVVTQKQKGAAEHTSKNMETPARMISKSMSFKSTNLGRSSATESKVKMLSSKSTHAQDLKGSRLAKEWGAVDRKSLSRVDRPPVCSTMSSSVVSTPKGDQKLTPRSETSKPLSGNNRELKVNQDGKSSSLSKSASSVGRKGVEPPVSSERTSINVDETLQDLLPRSRETTNQVEKNRESSSDRMRPGVNTAPKSTFCPKCKESGHSTECCSVGCTPESGIEVSATRSSKEEMHKGNRLKAAINAALLRRPEICKKKEVPNQTGGFSTSATDLNCEAISQDQVLASSTPKNSISAEVTHEGQENLESSTFETSKCSSINDATRSRETTNQVEKNRESSSDHMRPGVNTAPKSTFCPKCKESGHSTECCTVHSTPESGIEVSATRSSKEEMHKGNRLKAAINAALLRRPEICKKKEVPNQTGGFSTSATDLNCEAISQDQVLASSTPKNSISAEVTHEGQENLESSTSETSKCSSINDATRSRETTNQVEKNRESSNDRMRPGVNTTPKSTFCPKCKESGHSTECCTVRSMPESGIEISATRSSKEEMHKGNRLKAAINAALLRRPEICKKKEVPNQTGGFSTSGTDLNCEAISQDQLLASSTPKNSVSAEVTHEGQENLESSTSETSKCSSVNDVKQLNACPIDSCPQLEDSDSVGPAGKSPVRDLSNEALAISNVLSTMPAIPEYDYIWQGILEVHRGGKPPDLFAGIQAHLSACASPKVLEVVNKFSPKVSLNEVPRLSTWPSQFNQGGAKEDNVALYFFAKDVESYERHYKGLLDQMIRNDLALKGIFDGVELLIFPSNQLPEKSQRWNMLFFLWGVFRGRRMNNSDSAEKICIPSLNMPVEKDFPTAVMTLSETRCSPKRMDEDSINCDRTSSMVLASTSVDQSHVTLARNSDIKEIDLEQMHLGSQVNLQKQDSRFNTKSTLTLPTSSAQLCQEMKSPGSSLNGSLLEDGPDRESKISLEAMGTSAASRIMETKTDCDISVKEENSSSGNEEIGAARIITEDKMSERMNRVKDLERPKRKQREDDRFIDIEAAIEEDLTIEGVNCWQPTDKNLIDPSGTVFQASGITCQRMPWNEVNSKLEDGESSSKKLKTGFGGIYGGRDILNGSFVSFANDLGSCSSVEDKGCVEACDEKIIREDLGTMERTFFPVDAHNKNDFQLRENSCPQKGPNEHEDQFRDGIPNLELALGGDTKPPHKGMLPFFVGVVDKKNNQGKRRDGLTDEQEDDGVAASLSLSLSFPSSNKERVKPVSKAEQLLPDGHRVNTSLLLFGSFSDK